MIIHLKVLSIYCCLFCLVLQDLAEGWKLFSLWKIKMIYGYWIDFSLSLNGHKIEPCNGFQFCSWKVCSPEVLRKDALMKRKYFDFCKKLQMEMIKETEMTSWWSILVNIPQGNDLPLTPRTYFGPKLEQSETAKLLV